MAEGLVVAAGRQRCRPPTQIIAFNFATRLPPPTPFFLPLSIHPSNSHPSESTLQRCKTPSTLIMYLSLASNPFYRYWADFKLGIFITLQPFPLFLPSNYSSTTPGCAYANVNDRLLPLFCPSSESYQGRSTGLNYPWHDDNIDTFKGSFSFYLTNKKIRRRRKSVPS